MSSCLCRSSLILSSEELKTSLFLLFLPSCWHRPFFFLLFFEELQPTLGLFLFFLFCFFCFFARELPFKNQADHVPLIAGILDHRFLPTRASQVRRGGGGGWWTGLDAAPVRHTSSHIPELVVCCACTRARDRGCFFFFVRGERQPERFVVACFYARVCARACARFHKLV